MRPDKASKNDAARASAKAVAPTRSPDEGTSGIASNEQMNGSKFPIESDTEKTSSRGNETDTNDFQTAASSLLALGFSAQPSRPNAAGSAKSPMLSLLSDVAINEPTDSQVSQTVDDDGVEGQKITPGTRDVLCGRGRGYFNHPGNRRMLDIVNQNKGRYKAAGKTMKTIIVRDVTDIIQAGGTRFLKLSNSHWHGVSALEAHKKVCHCLREEKNNTDTGFETVESRKLKQVEMVDHLKQLKEELLMGADGSVDSLPPPGGNPSPRRKKNSKTASRRSDFSSSASDSSTAASSSGSEDTGTLPFDYTSQEKQSSGAKNRGGQDYYPSDRQEEEMANATAVIPADRIATSDAPRQDKGPDSLDTTVLNKPKVTADVTVSMTGGTGVGYTQAHQSSSMRPHDDGGRTENVAAPAEAHAAALDVMGMGGLQSSQYGIVVGEPSPLDVLFGVDPAFATTSGNMRLRQMVRAAVGYSVTSVEDKLLMARGIVGQLKLGSARFLTRHSNAPRGIWFIVADVEAEALIFRYLCEEENTTKAAMLRVGGFGAPPGLLSGVNPHASFAAATNAFGSGLAARSAFLRAENEAMELKRKQEGGEGGELTSIFAAASVNMDPKDIYKKRKLEDFSNDSSLSNGQSKLLRTFQNGGFSSRPSHAMGRNLTVGEESRPLTMGPGPHDVVCGRGRGNFRHPGNRRLLRIFQEYKHRYRAATKTQKTNIAKEIVIGIQSRGGRFLKRTDDGVWVTVCDKEAFRKVCHGIRDIPKDQDDIDMEKKVTEDGSVGSDSTNRGDKMSPAPEVSEAKNEYTQGSDMRTRPLAFQVVNAITTPPKNDSLKSDPPQSIEPEAADIVCGRGRGNFSHPGNRRMLNIIHRNRERYRGAPTKSEKAEISREVMAAILSNGGRFLKRKDPESSVWEEVEFKDALKKVCHGIRDSLCNGVKAKKKPDKKQSFGATTSLAESKGSTRGKEKSKSGSTSADPGSMKLFELAELAQKRASREEQTKDTEKSISGVQASATSAALRNPALDPYYIRSLQVERAAAAGIPMHTFVAAQKAAAATGMTVEEVIMTERQNGRQCSIS
jgi:hypothetical protein